MGIEVTKVLSCDNVHLNSIYRGNDATENSLSKQEQIRISSKLFLPHNQKIETINEANTRCLLMSRLQGKALRMLVEMGRAKCLTGLFVGG